MNNYKVIRRTGKSVVINADFFSDSGNGNISFYRMKGDSTELFAIVSEPEMVIKGEEGAKE